MFGTIIKKFCLFCAIGAAVYGLDRFCHKKTDGFAVAKIRTALPSSFPVNNSEDDTKLALSILQSRLSYIGRGGQCYAFATPDGKYVVKLLKYNNNYPDLWLRLFPFPFGKEPYRQQKLQNKLRKLQGEYTSYEIAASELKEETGIIYFHLTNSSLPKAVIHIKDKLGILHDLPADRYQFYIQKKGTPLYPQIQNLLQTKGLDPAKEVLNELTRYLVKRCQKGITDRDDGIWRNFAFYEGKPFQIDIGQFSKVPSLSSEEEYRKDILFFTKDFLKWLTITSPPLAEHLMQTIDRETTGVHPPDAV